VYALINVIKTRLSGFVFLLKNFIPAIYRLVSPRLRWGILQKQGVVSVGKHSYGIPNVYTWSNDTKLEIGNFCSIAEDVTILLHAEHRVDWLTTYPFSAMGRIWEGANEILGHPTTKGNIILGHDVWVGHGAVILSGVKVGNGAVIAAGSVVVKDVEDFAIVAGNPAKFIRFRFEQDVREVIAKTAWWNWSDERITKNLKHLMSTPEEFKRDSSGFIQ
jgi:chloramphenicol O-acetyltransferase type B